VGVVQVVEQAQGPEFKPQYHHQEEEEGFILVQSMVTCPILLDRLPWQQGHVEERLSPHGGQEAK
jgi:hypothetical protein